MSDKDIKAPVVQWFLQQTGSSCGGGTLAMAVVSGMPASVPMGTSYELHSFAQHNPQNSFI
jgi:hypothetical protein